LEREVPRISKPNEIKLRRAAALELTAKGYSQTEIAHRLNYHKSTISNDIRYLKEQAQKQFKQHDN
jgi:transposase